MTTFIMQLIQTAVGNKNKNIYQAGGMLYTLVTLKPGTATTKT